MSYEKMMRWQRTHRRGTRQPVLMSTGSGFWSAKAWLQEQYWPYVEACRVAGIHPLDSEAFYRATTGKQHFPRSPEVYALMTHLGTLS